MAVRREGRARRSAACDGGEPGDLPRGDDRREEGGEEFRPVEILFAVIPWVTHTEERLLSGDSDAGDGDGSDLLYPNRCKQYTLR